LNANATVSEQADWLARIRPAYILGYPSAIRAVADYLYVRNYRLDELRQIRTFGEILEPECRAACHRAFGVTITDAYSSQEVGYIATQCPKHEHYHVQSEGVFVEVLDEQNRPCRAGEVGNVCDCGRGLPVLNRILGRQRNMLTLPDGSRRWPNFAQGGDAATLPPIYQFQVIQRGLQQIEIKVVRPAPFSADEKDRVIAYLQKTLGHPFDVSIDYVEQVPRSPSGKFEDFVSDVVP
jgi:phenylacetate-CoA ligase